MGSHSVTQSGVTITAHCCPKVLGSSDPTTSASQVAETTGTCYHAHLIFKFFVKYHYVVQAGFKLLTSGDPPISASQIAGITGVSHCAWPALNLRTYFIP